MGCFCCIGSRLAEHGLVSFVTLRGRVRGGASARVYSRVHVQARFD